MQMSVIDCAYHRNGITGVGFYAIEFTYIDEEQYEQHALATVDADQIEAVRNGKRDFYNPGTRIILLDESGCPDIKMTMRGDHFHGELVTFLLIWIEKDRVARNV
jgi:hypothetical protein